MRQEMLAGKPPKGCEKCVDEEAAGIESKRQNLLKQQPEFFALAESANAASGHMIQEVGFELGNSCNLACVTCNPSASTTWNKDAAVAGYERKPLLRADIERLRPHLDHLSTLQLLGGETFLIPDLQNVLQLVVSEGRPENVHLKISTNATTFPKPEIIRLLDRFAMVHIDCSIDAHGPRNEYLRFPSKWSQIEEVMAQWMEWRRRRFNGDLFLAPTVSAYSLPGLPQLLSWWQEFCQKQAAAELAKSLNFAYVSDPIFQAPQVLPRALREKICAELRGLPAPLNRVSEPVITYVLNGDDPENLATLHRWSHSLDQARGVSARAAAPEIFGL